MYGITHVPARLDEQVGPELCDVRLEQVELVADDPRQAAKREAVGRVLLAVDGRQQRVEPVGALDRHQPLRSRGDDGDVPGGVLDDRELRREHGAADCGIGPGREHADVRLERRRRHPVREQVDVGAVPVGRPLRLELVDVDGDHAGDVLEDAVDVGEVDRRPERDRVEVERGERGCPGACGDLVRDVPRVDRDRAAEQPPGTACSWRSEAGSSGRARGRGTRRSGGGPRRRRFRRAGRPRSGGSSARGRPRPRSPAPSPLPRSPGRGRRSPPARPHARTSARSPARSARASSGCSWSAPPRAASGFVTSRRPGGRSSAEVSVFARTRPATPEPTRYVAWTLPVPVGTVEPVTPVAELDGGEAVVLRARGEHLGSRRLAVEARHLRPRARR